VPGPSRRMHTDPDHGSAMVVTLMVLAVLTALSTTVAAVTVSNLGSAWRAQQSGAAVSAADAGVAQAVTYLRTQGVRDLRCSPSCADNPWGNQTSPMTASVAGQQGQSYRVWIEPLAPYPDNDPARYRIHSTGTAAGDAVRAVTTDVQLTVTDIPKGVFAKSITGGGTADVHRQSVFTTGCVYNRSKIQFEGMDAAYGIPAGVHSSQIITDSNGSGQYCPTTKKPIHRTGSNNDTPLPCNAAYPYDQDRLGGSLLGTGCESTQLTYPAYQPTDHDDDGSYDVEGSFIRDDNALFRQFGIRYPALTEAQIDELRTTAQSQGNYYTSANTGPWAPDESNAVMFFDLNSAPSNQRTVDLNDVTGFSRSAGLSESDPACTTSSLVIVIEGGNVRLNSNQELFASVFLTSSAPYGQVFKANGTAQFIGTLYADNIDLTGTADLSMDACFLDNMSPGLFEIEVSSYRELDR
jgi:hypothetical protein